MTESALDLLHQVISSPWVYMALFVLAALDGFLPVIPGETALVTAAVFAVSAEPHVVVVILAGAAGAFAGDHISYLMGRSSIGRLTERIPQGGRSRAAYDWVDATLARRGGQVLLASRYVPGVRTATTLTMGAVRYPLRSFAAFDALAAVLWAAGWSLVGYVGGAAFGNDPIAGLLFGLGLAFALMLLSEVARRLWRALTNRREWPTNREAATRPTRWWSLSIPPTGRPCPSSRRTSDVHRRTDQGAASARRETIASCSPRRCALSSPTASCSSPSYGWRRP